MDQELIDLVVTQIVEDVNQGDLTAIEELLATVDPNRLRGFLVEIA